MSDSFFSEIDWAKLERKDLDPPQVLMKENATPDDSKARQKASNRDIEDDLLFEKDDDDTRKVL